jgi:hypothetical protein
MNVFQEHLLFSNTVCSFLFVQLYANYPLCIPHIFDVHMLWFPMRMLCSLIIFAKRHAHCGLLVLRRCLMRIYGTEPQAHNTDMTSIMGSWDPVRRPHSRAIPRARLCHIFKF